MCVFFFIIRIGPGGRKPRNVVSVKPLLYRRKLPGPSFFACNILAPREGLLVFITVSDDRSYAPGYTTVRFSKQEQDSDGQERSVKEPRL